MPIIRLIVIVPSREISIEYLSLFLSALSENGSGTSTQQLTVPTIKPKLVALPPLNEQKRIANIYENAKTIIKSIENEKREITNFCNFAKKKILDQVFQENSSYKSYYKKTIKLGLEINSISTRNKEIKSRDVKTNGKYKVISQSKNSYDGFSDDESLLIDNVPVVIFGDHTRVVKKVEDRFIPGADGIKILKPKSVNFDYFYYCVLYASLKIDNKGYARHFSLLKDVEVPIYSLEKQKEISFDITSAFKILDTIIC